MGTSGFILKKRELKNAKNCTPADFSLTDAQFS